MKSALHPNQFQVNEAWIVFQLNETPIHTAKDGSFNCICLMSEARDGYREHMQNAPGPSLRDTTGHDPTFDC